MKLTFRGNRYEASNDGIFTVETNQTAQFRGHEYKVRTALQTANRNNADLTYRGVHY